MSEIEIQKMELKKDEESQIENIPKRFLLEIMTGVITFMIIAIAAVLLSYFVNLLKDYNIDPIIIYGLTLVEYLIFIVDIVLFLRFLWLTFIRTWKTL